MLSVGDAIRTGMRSKFLLTVCLLPLLGCGDSTDADLFAAPPSAALDASSLRTDAAVVDATTDARTDAGAANCPGSGGACKAGDVPQGWSLVAYARSGQPACPADFGAAEDVVADATVGQQACSCSCNKAQDPDCQTGPSVLSGVGQSCNVNAGTYNFSAGKCAALGGTVDDFDKATTIAPSGGVCNIQAVPNDAAIKADAARFCAVSATCQPAACGGYAPAGFKSCIVSDGDVACPAGSPFSAKHTASKQAHVACAGCGQACTFQGKCDQPKLSFFYDSACAQLIATIPADGSCAPTGKANAQLHGVTYTAKANFSGCTATATPTASLDLPNVRTVCCR